MSQGPIDKMIETARQRPREANEELADARRELQAAEQSGDAARIFGAKQKVASAEGAVEGRQRVLDDLKRR